MRTSNRAVFVVVLVCAGLLITLFGCDLPGTIASGEPGSLSLSFNNRVRDLETFLPDIVMDVSYLVVAGTGPNQAEFEQRVDSISQDFEKSDLVPGTWMITVGAFNADDDLIGEGVDSVLIISQQTAEKTILIQPLSGNGSFSLDVTWDQAIVSPSLTYTLSQGSTVIERSETFSIDGQGASLDIATLPSGYYLIEIQLKQSGAVVGNAVAALRIVEGASTTGTLTVLVDPLGTALLSFSLLMDDPIPITFDGFLPALEEGGSMSVSAQTDEAVDTYRWYLNGVLLSGENSSSLTIGSTLAKGRYQLTSVITKGSIICFRQAEFTVGSGSVSGTIVDGTTAQPVIGAVVVIVGLPDLTDTTDEEGYFIIENVPLGEQSVLITHEGSTDITIPVTVEGTATIPVIPLSPTITTTGSFRVVLSWGATPPDLDSHLVTADDQHICFYSPVGTGVALDVDDTDSYGPETITVQTLVNGTYSYYVHNFTGEDSIVGSNARVEVYDESGLLKTYTPPQTGGTVWWHVFDYDGTTFTDRQVYLDVSPLFNDGDLGGELV